MILQDIPGWLASGGSMSSSSATSMSVSSMGSSIPSPSQHDFPDLDTTCSEALEESWVSISEELWSVRCFAFVYCWGIGRV